MKSRLVLATIGSLGDLHPFIALGRALRERGADVVLACAAEYQQKVERSGLEFEAVRPSFDDMQRALGMSRAELTAAALSRTDFLFRRLIMPHVRESYEDMLRITAETDLVLTSSLAFGARLAAERRKVDWLAVVLQPLMFLSAYDPPVIPRAGWVSPLLRRLGPEVTGASLSVVKFAADRLLRPVHRLRREIGLPKANRNPLFEGQFSPLGAIGLYSQVLGPVRDDYPASVAVVGFAAFDGDEAACSELPDKLRDFLERGAPPLVFTLGSLIVNSPGTFYAASVAAARRLRSRAVLLVGEGGEERHAALASEDVCLCAYAAHSRLFPRASAVIHHGGIGTLAQALASGRPQLIVPFFADQLDNAARAMALGCARSIAPKRYTAQSAAAALEAMRADARYARQAGAVRDRLADEDGAAEAARVILNRLESATLSRGVTR